MIRYPRHLTRLCGRFAALVLALVAGPVPAMAATDALHSEPALSGASALMNSAGDWLLAQQLPDGTFPWTTGGPAFASVQGQPGLALIEAWRVTGRQDFLDAATVAADVLIGGGFEAYPGPGENMPRIRSADPLFFNHLSQATGDPQYRDFISQYFWARLAAGVYGPDADWDIHAYVQDELARRLNGGQPVLAAWDLVQVAVAAQVAGRGAATMQALLDGAVTALEAAPGQYDIVGLSWSVAGGALFNHEMDPQAGLWAGAGGTDGLAAILAGYPEANGGYVYLSSSLGNPNQASAQSTAFALFGLASLDLAGHYGLIRNGLDFIEGKQMASGQILDISNPNIAGNVLGHADAMRVYGMIVNEFRTGLTVTKTALPSVPAPDIGDTIDYQIIVLNSGNTPLTGIDIDDDLVDLDCVPALPVASLDGGQAITCTGTYTVTAADLDAGTDIVNIASATGTSVNGKQLDASDQTSTALAEARPGLSVVKSITAGNPYSAAGEVIGYDFQITNSGNVSVASLTLVDDLIGPVTCPATSLAAGAGITCQATYTVQPQDVGNGSVTNTAQASATPVRGLPSPVTASDQATATWSLAAMALAKSASPSVPEPGVGDHIDYLVVLTNTGSEALTQVQVDDPLVALACTPALPVASLPAGASISCSGSYLVSQADVDAATPVLNTASASATGPDGPLQAQDSTSTPVLAARADIALAKTITAGSPYSQVGDVISYSYLVSNTGTATLQAISLVDDRIGTITCPASQLAPAATMTCTGNDTVQAADIQAGSVVNIAVASAQPAAGGPAVSASSSAVAHYAGPPPEPVAPQPVPGPGRLALALLAAVMLLLGGLRQQRHHGG